MIDTCGTIKETEEFSEDVLGILNSAGLAMMTSIGHRTGLFEVMDGLPAATSEEIARKADLNERYVREWLGSMVTGGFVIYQPGDRTYLLPAEHAAVLTPKAGADNLASKMQWVSSIGGVETKVVQCFREGGGVSYSNYERFHEIMAAESGQVFDQTLLQTTLPLVPGLMDRLREGIDVLDVGCGSGHAINLIARAFPKSRCTGCEFSEEGLATARSESSAWGLENARFEHRDVANLDGNESFDIITAFDSIHDQAYPDQVLAGIARALRPAGTFLMVDIAASSNLEENRDHPLGPFLYAISTLHCMTVSLAQGGAGLGTVWGEEKACTMLREAGFTSIDVKKVEGDIMNSYFIATRGTRSRAAS